MSYLNRNCVDHRPISTKCGMKSPCTEAKLKFGRLLFHLEMTSMFIKSLTLEEKYDS